ncbi:hypothetical protein COCVIDRAFT_29992 [Bipolaris victoriae FI3]|uniref:Uncharacterized protein n=1 Tax=Bipolaris victoriae (strain FI3) TaxID=930091 RepID=W7E7M7_BIPV3|nr:hypothetical protein COCVIDRAFT_29992 [Bipolaris victoriae FI3]
MAGNASTRGWLMWHSVRSKLQLSNFRVWKDEREIPLIREDVDVKEGDSIVPTAIYRRADRQVMTGPTVKSPAIRTMIVENRKWKPFMTIYSPVSRTKRSGLDEPAAKSPYELTIEIGRFKNWEQANSWAVRIEWEYPVGSGNWRYMYVQSEHTVELADHRVPGSFKSYMKGIAFLQWITGSEQNHHHAWIPKIRGKARVMQCDTDMMNQTFVFRSKTDPIFMLPGDIIPDDAIKNLMMKPECGLRVNVQFGDFGSAMVGHRKFCDTCCLVQAYLNWSSFPDKTCTKDKLNDSRCTTCAHFGRPWCSWTPGLPSLRTLRSSASSPEQVILVQKTLFILVRLPKVEIPPEKQSFTLQLRGLEDIHEEDDGGDRQGSEDEDEDENEVDDEGDDEDELEGV